MLNVQSASLSLLGFLSFLASMTSPYISSAQTWKRPVLLVVNQGDASLSIVDPDRNRQLAKIVEGVPSTVGHEIASSPNGRFAFMPLYGNSGLGKPGTDGSLVLVFDIRERRINGRIDLLHGVRPHCIVYDPTSGLLYLTTELDQSVTILDPKTLSIVGTIPTEQAQSHMLAISHDGQHGYTANVGPGTVSVLDLRHRKLVKTIPISGSIQRISISKDDQMVFTADQTSPRLAVIDTTEQAVTRWVPLPSIGYGSASTKNGKSLLVTLPIAGDLAVVDLRTMLITHKIAIGPKPQEVLVRPDGAVAYVSCFGGNQVAVVDLKTWKVKAMINVGKGADGMAWVPAAR